MSLRRFVYYSAVIAGWAALLAWWIAEILFLHNRAWPSTAKTAATGAVVGAVIGAGLNLVSGMTNAQWKRQLQRITPGLVGGGLGGLVGALLGTLMYSGLGLPRALGWMLMGLAIGSAEGIYERSPSKIRNGLIGGAIGGLLGGLLFDPIASSRSDMSSRAAAFVILGVSIGALVGLTHVVLKEAWLTVVDGFRPGRQLILSQTVTMLGRGDHLPLPFLDYAGRDLESEHVRITRQPDGSFTIEDNHSRIGTLLNGQQIQGRMPLGDGDLIKLGSNIVRFNQRHSIAAGVAAGPSDQALAMPPGPPPAIPKPPPVPQGAARPGATPPPMPLGPAPGAPQSPVMLPPQPGPLPSSPRIPPPPPPPVS